MKQRIILVSIAFILILNSCVGSNDTSLGDSEGDDFQQVEQSTRDNPPYLGVFLNDGSEYVALDKFVGPPETKPELSTDTPRLIFTVWLDNFVAENFVLLSYISTDITKHNVEFLLLPAQQNGVYEAVVPNLPEPDTYCFVLGNMFSTIYNIPHYCFEYNPNSNIPSTIEVTPTPHSPIIWDYHIEPYNLNYDYATSFL